MAVNFYGRSADMKQLNEFIKKHNLKLIEDAAHSLGSFYGNKHQGTKSDMGVFSFSTPKIITTGQGGMIVTNNKILYERCCELKDFGRKIGAKKNMKRSAAIASKEAAEIYEMNVIDENIQDHKDNFTRFFCLSKNRTKSTGNDKTSIVYSAGDVSGALYKALKEFANGDINLTKIESRLTRKKAWEYNFYLDFEGHIDDNNCKKAVEGLINLGSTVKILGSYPKSNNKL